MDNTPMNALVVLEDCDVFEDRDDPRLLHRAVANRGFINGQLVGVTELDEALPRLRKKPDVVLLDLARSATHLANIVALVREKAPGVPVLLLPEGSDGCDAAELVRRAAADGQDATRGWQSNGLVRALRRILPRQQSQSELLRMALMDDLTGLHNRRGFRVLADEYIRSARRMKKHLLLFIADLDGLKQINDAFGHGEGDRALVWTAESLRRTFRRSDITARLGGDEFAALMIEGQGRSAASVRHRLQRNLSLFASREIRYRLSLSIGVARFDPQTASSLQDLVGRADSELYAQKRGRRTSPAMESPARIAEAPRARLCNEAL